MGEAGEMTLVLDEDVVAPSKKQSLSGIERSSANKKREKVSTWWGNECFLGILKKMSTAVCSCVRTDGHFSAGTLAVEGGEE